MAKKMAKHGKKFCHKFAISFAIISFIAKQICARNSLKVKYLRRPKSLYGPVFRYSLKALKKALKEL